eukprot:GEMP01086618.1.p1 GENE.GEMP01086618.1~~GEMP01086618.1.p1  ORF type:complete len:175 (+),score=27.68 GEMP01086618.1:100-624(+)
MRLRRPRENIDQDSQGEVARRRYAPFVKTHVPKLEENDISGLATIKSHQIAKVVASGQLQSLTGHAKHIPKSVCDTREEFTSLTRGFTEVWAWKIQPIAIDGPFDCTFPEFLVQNVEFHPAKKLKLEDFVASCSETQRENGDEWLNNRHGKVCKALEVRAQIVAFRQLLTAPPK